MLTGDSVAEAIDLANKLYGGKNKEVKCEIVSDAKKGFLGIGSKKAEVRVTVIDNEDELSGIVKSIKESKDSEDKKSAFEKKDEMKKEKQAPKEETKKELPKEEPAEPEKSVKEEKSAPKETKAPETKESDEVVSDAEYACRFINTIVSNMGLGAFATPVEDYEAGEEGEDRTPIVISGDDTGILIGHHGETLDALQYLANLAILRRGDGKRTGRDAGKIRIDIENYRAKREDTLKNLARRKAAAAVKYRRDQKLEPMNPYERRIIHAELQDYPDVSTHSIGADASRRIVITYEGPGKYQKYGRKNKSSAAEADTAADLPEENIVSDISDTPEEMPLPTLD